MKKYISFFIVVTLLLSMFAGIGGTALAAGAGIRLNTNSVTVNAGENVSVTAAITNNFTEPFTDCQIKVNGAAYGNGAALAVNDSREVPVSFPVTEAMLNTDVTFTAEYKTASTGDAWQTGDPATLHIAKKELAVKIAASATSSLSLAKPGDVLTLTVNVENQGEATLENIEVKAAQVKTAWAPANFTLAPGQKQPVTCQYTFTAKATIAPTITYTVAGAPQTYNVETPIVIDQELRGVKPSLAISNPSPQPGEEVTVTLTVTNEGNVPYTDLKVTRGGQPVDFPTTTLKGGETFTKEYKMTFQTSELVEFVITLKDQKNAMRTVKTSLNVQLPVDPNALSSSVKLNLEPDRTELTAAGTITFSGGVSNNSEYKITEVSVSEPTLGVVYSVSEMEPGTRQPVEKTVDINGTTTYNFTLTFKDRNGQPYTVNLDPVTVSIQSAEPSPTDVSEDAAQVTLEPKDKQSDPLLIWFIIAGVLLVLIIGVGVAIIVLWKKGKSPSRVSAARSAVPRPSGPKAGPRPSGPKAGPRPRTPYKSGARPNKSKGSFRDRNNF